MSVLDSEFKETKQNKKKKQEKLKVQHAVNVLFQVSTAKRTSLLLNLFSQIFEVFFL